MHITVWVITNLKEPDTDGMPTADILPALENQSRDITQHLSEHELPDSCYPPIHFDYRRTLNTFTHDGSAQNQTAGPPYATGAEAAKLENSRLPKAIITPEGRYIYISDEEERSEIRRAALHWPENLILAEDWHY